MRRILFTLLIFMMAHMAAALSQPASRQVIPAAALSEGGNGSYWRSDVTVYNPSDLDVTVTFDFYPSVPEGSFGTHLSVTSDMILPAGRSITWPDILGIYFPEERLGALIVSAKDSAQKSVDILANSRIWTPSLEGEGSFGQGVPGIAYTESGDLSATNRVIQGVENSEYFRSNIGIVNLTGTLEEIFDIEIVDDMGERTAVRRVILGPYAHIQINNILGNLGLEGGGFTAITHLVSANQITPGVPGGEVEPTDFTVYGSRIDRKTNDPIYIAPSEVAGSNNFSRQKLIPAAALIEGGNNSYWRTDLTIFNPSLDEDIFIEIDLIPSTPEGAADNPPYTFLLDAIGPGATVTVEDVLGDHFSPESLGALIVKGVDSTFALKDINVTSRTWTPREEGDGGYGQGIPGIKLESYSDPMVIAGLESSEHFRSNLGLVNASLNLRETFSIEFFDHQNIQRASDSYILEPWSHLQITDVLRGLGLEGSGYIAKVTLVESENLFINPSESWDPFYMAYGSRVDRKTNDPTYLAAALLKTEEPGSQGEWYDFEEQEPWYVCPSEEFPEESTVVTAYDQAYHYFGAENMRTIVQEVDFPENGVWKNQVGLYFRLECPENGLCDHWDRLGSVQMVVNPDDPQEAWEYIELLRHITPYRIEMCEYIDLTPLAGLLKGRQTLHSYIDTWVGPGHSDGEGWRLSLDFVFYPGADGGADEVLNIWGRRNIVVGYLDEENNVDSQVDPVSFFIPPDATKVEAHLITTGHSWGNTFNCAEFCMMRNHLFINGTLNVSIPWRNDCEYNPHSPQAGTWQYDRNGWCPGAVSLGDIIDITDQVATGEENILDFDIRMLDGSEYENSDPVGWDPHEVVSLRIYIYR